MDFTRSKRLMIIWAACYWILAATVYLVAGQQFHYTSVTSDALSATATIGELVDGMTVTQRTIERVAQNIIEALRARFPDVRHVRCTVAKLAPPLGGKIARVAVTLEG